MFLEINEINEILEGKDTEFEMVSNETVEDFNNFERLKLTIKGKITENKFVGTYIRTKTKHVPSTKFEFKEIKEVEL